MQLASVSYFLWQPRVTLFSGETGFRVWHQSYIPVASNFQHHSGVHTKPPKRQQWLPGYYYDSLLTRSIRAKSWNLESNKTKTPDNWKAVGVTFPTAQSNNRRLCPNRRYSKIMSSSKGMFPLMVRMRLNRYCFRLATSFCLHLFLLPLHVNRRSTVFQRQNPTGAPRLQTVSIPLVGTKTSGTVRKKERVFKNVFFPLFTKQITNVSVPSII